MDHRLVSPMEMYSVARHQMNFYQTVSCYLRFRIPSFSLSEWKVRFEKAIHSTIEAQPRLRLQVDLSRPQAYFIILPMNIFDRLPIEILERISDDDDDDDDEFLDKTLEHESNIGFIHGQSSPLWRIVLIVSSHSHIVDFIFVYSHAIGDGISGMAFFTSFLQCLSGKSPSTFSLHQDQPSNELIPSNLPPLSSMISQIIEKILLPNFLSRYFFPKTYWTGNLHLIGNEPNQTRLVSFKLSATILDLLHRKCRMEQTTIHAALLASILLSITEIVGRKNMEFFCSTAVNIRRYCQPMISNQQMGVYVSSADSYHYIPYREHLIDLFWTVTRQIKEQINDNIEHATLPLVQSLKFISNWKEFLINQRKTLPNGYHNSVDLSNLLRWSFESDDQLWHILQGGMTQSANIIGSAFMISAATVNNILTVNIAYQQASFQNHEQVQMIRDRMKQFLIDASSLENE